MKRNIITIQSQVATGYVGNRIADLAIQLHGLDPIEIPTILLSNHVEYPVILGEPTPEHLFSDLLKGIDANHLLQSSDYLISGFCNDPKLVTLLGDYISHTKTASQYQYVYDPVFGDYRAGGLYIPKEAADLSIEKLLPLSDILTPNHFELEYILKDTIVDEADFLNKIQQHPILSTKTVVATGVQFKSTSNDTLHIILYREGKIIKFNTPHLAINIMGTGDLFTAVVTCQLNKGKTIEIAIETAIHYLHETLLYCQEQNYREYNAEALVKHLSILQ
ncbi:PfkB family carbohydrate kinase [Elizabethkingia sp. JS20170427COW]|uniref:PfkB family carbohydrate kinase n=1 Tax=Elizabethkingia sp. JS20170427COW TaxID=2583851 RepID=UPI001110EF1F|nr:PfkB family carbohydrate kinase [Elizabethkingia sp. JS20170427COW]QCX54187.1 pyridoxal kinase [Elizabethkingia sp. JS20170427COW]